MPVKSIFAVAAVATSLGWVGFAHADSVTYTYSGSPYENYNAPYAAGESVTGTFTLSAPLGINLVNFQPIVTSFSFSDGVQTITNSETDLRASLFQFSTDSLGNITHYGINLRVLSVGGVNDIQAFTDGVESREEVSVWLSADDVGTAQTFHAIATFAIASPVPEPSTWAMLLVGFAGIGAVTYGRRKAALAASSI